MVVCRVALTPPEIISAMEGGGTRIHDGFWPNRDPIGESGFEAMRSTGLLCRSVDPIASFFIKNDPINATDPFGLDVNSDAWSVSGESCGNRYCIHRNEYE